MKEMSDRQKEVYDFIEEYHEKNGYSPSIGDVASSLGIAHTTAATYIDALRRKGRVTSVTGIPRSLKVVPAAAV